MSNKPVNTPSYEEIQKVVQVFYAKARVHPQIGPFFKIIDDFAEHEKRISDFWYLSMGGQPEPRPKIDMLGKHFPLGIKAEDLDVWLGLFSETLEQELDENKALFWMDKVLTIAARLKQIVIDHQAMGVQIKDH